ncbi:MAG: hypothetical protein R2825_18880 [Saprospiraceae bacterium]
MSQALRKKSTPILEGFDEMIAKEETQIGKLKRNKKALMNA